MKKFFARGLYALLPLLITIAVFYLVVSFVFEYVGTPIGDLLRVILKASLGMTDEEIWAHDTWSFYYGEGEEETGAAPYIGFVLGIILIFFIGIVMATFIGKWFYSLFEKLITRVPIIKQVYPYAKQFTGFFTSGENKIEFKTVVAIPFPTQGIYSIGFVTSEGLKTINEAQKKPYMTVFIPTSPTPMSGYVCYVPREDIIPLPMSVEEAMRIIISCGVLTPTHQQVDILGRKGNGDKPAPAKGE